jgi:hypothetical protein
MRTKNVKPKIAEEVAIPERLVAFLREVHELIEQDDDAATIESDDLLQTEFAYGGLLEEDGDEFGFTYFSDEGARAKWEFELSASDIAAIAQGDRDTLRLWRCRTPGCRNRFGSPDEACFDCDYVDDKP